MNVRNVLPRDAIPSVDDPVFGPQYDGDDDDEMILLETEPPKAYPVRYLHYHEIVNDTLCGHPTVDSPDSVPVAVTWCPLCGSAVVYDRRLGDRTLTFGVSGKLADDDLVMYDRETESEWKQSLGEAIAGELKGQSLTVLPMSVTSWSAFRQANPDGVVLQPSGGKSEAASDGDEPGPISYDSSPYERYFESEGFGLAAHRHGESDREWNRDDLGPKTLVLGVELGEPLGFPHPWVQEAGGVVTTTVGEAAVVVFATSEGIHAYENPGYTFEKADNDRYRANGTVWNGATGQSEDGRSLDRLPARRLFAFAWQDDHGPDSFYEPTR